MEKGNYHLSITSSLPFPSNVGNNSKNTHNGHGKSLPKLRILNDIIENSLLLIKVLLSL
jgi:hypothetical protein